MNNLKDFVIEDGVLKKYTGTKAKVIIPEGVISIGDSAFSDCEDITSVIIPEGVTYIGNSAFMWCESLKSVNIPLSVTHIGRWAFAGCDRLDGLIIPDGVETIGEGAFYQCENMADEDGFLVVRNVLYCYCGEAENVTVPSFVTSISYGAFMGCNFIRSVSIPESVEAIGPGAFCGCTGLADENGFVIIRDVLYDYSGNDKAVTIPSGVISISDWAFSPFQGYTIGCGDVNWYKQSSSPYYSCIEDLVIPESVRSIGAYAFHNCSLPKETEIPEGVTSVGIGAFSECRGLETIILPVSIKETESIFNETDSLTAIVAQGIAPQKFSKSNEKQLAVLGFVFHMEHYRDSEIFEAYCQSLFRMKKNILPLLLEKDHVQGVALFAQSGKITAMNYEEEFFEPALAANATECVAYLMEWKNKNISEESIAKATERSVEEDPYQASDMKKLWTYEKLADGTLCITGYKGEEADVEIPFRIGENPVTAIGGWAFSPDKPKRVKNQRLFLSSKFRSVTIPDSVISVGDHAFYKCGRLERVNISQKNYIFR